jgi:PAS domain S-box-containing protein
MNPRLIAAILLPFVACALQWLLWGALKPYVWFLFFPAAFFSAWLGGLRGGLAGTIIGALLVWFVFIPPQFSFVLSNPAAGFSIVVFVFMGSLFAFFFDRLQKSMRRTDEALAESNAAKAKITQLYEKTLELDKLKNQFFANVSHELRTPLTLILAPLEQRLHHAAALSEADRHELEIMLRNARLLYRHVTDLLDAAKLEAGRMKMTWTRIDLAALVRAMSSHFDSLAVENHLRYQIVAPDTLMADVDSEKLQRVLLNLLSNAFKFTPNGGGIILTLRAQDEQVWIAVQDSGIGVPTALREAVFERFRQGDGEVQRQYGGTGLGLAIVKDFVELHGGSVSVTEAQGGGALFSVVLPQHAPAGTQLSQAQTLDAVIDRQTVDELSHPTAPPVIAPANNNLPLVLVVEDNTDMNEFIATSLRPYYRVVSAFNGREGLAQALALHPDLILVDVMMPVMSGDEMVVALRQHPSLNNLPIVILTAKADDDLRVRMLQQGVQDYLNKPFLVDELLARVAGLVATRYSIREQIRISEARFEATFEQAAVGIALVAPDGHWLLTNRKLSKILGYSQQELSTLTFQSLTHPDDLTDDLAYKQQLVAGKIDHFAMEKRYLHKSGRYIWVNLTAALARKSDGSADYFVGVIEDIEARKQAEAEVLRLNNELERRVQERTAELTLANRELDSFSYAVSHDLRAPLRAMSGFSQALMEDFGDQLKGDGQLYLQQIDLASRKMSNLIDGLLMLSRSTRGNLQCDIINLSSLSARLLAELARNEPARHVAVEITPNLNVQGDGRMIEVVMLNLLGNAWKYTGHTENALIRVYADESGICISDNGAGFDMAHANRLFQPFQRLHRQEEFVGIGIGLATVQRIIHRHGGTITARGEPNKGATFCFTLPKMGDSKRGTED